MNDVTVTIKREPKGWRWSMDYMGDLSEGRFQFTTLQQAAQDAERMVGQSYWARMRNDPKYRNQRAEADAAAFGVDSFPAMPATAK